MSVASNIAHFSHFFDLCIFIFKDLMTNLGKKGIDKDVQNCLHIVTCNRQRYGTFEYIPLDMLVNILHVYTPQTQQPSPTATETSKVFLKGFENCCPYTTV